MKNRIFIVHCWSGHPAYCWYPKVSADLTNLGYNVVVLQMPTPDEPSQQTWVEVLSTAVGKPQKTDILIGHSIGSITILRYLESLPEDTKIKAAILVAGFTDNLGYKELSNFFVGPINFSQIKKRANKFILIHSDNDQYVDLKHGYKLRDELNATLEILPKRFHFSGDADNEQTCTDLAELTKLVNSLE